MKNDTSANRGAVDQPSGRSSVRALQAEVEDLRAVRQGLEAQVKDRDAGISNRDRMLAERDTVITSLDARIAALRALEEQNRALSAQVAEVDTRRIDAEEQFMQQAKRAENLTYDLRKAQVRYDNTAAECAMVKADVRLTQEAVQRQAEQITNLEAALESSREWSAKQRGDLASRLTEMTGKRDKWRTRARWLAPKKRRKPEHGVHHAEYGSACDCQPGDQSEIGEIVGGEWGA